MKRFLKVAAVIGLSAGICLAATACGSKSLEKVVPPDEAGSYSILTKLDLSVDFDGDTATARVKNTFTFFPAEARVHVYLYYSETEVNSYAEMEEVAAEYIEDLDQGETLSVSWDTKGRGGYFLGRMRYKIDSREWEEKCTDKYFRDYTKVVLEKIDDDCSLPKYKDIEPKLLNKDLTFTADNIFTGGSISIYNPYDKYKDFLRLYEANFNEPLTKEFYTWNFKESEYRKGRYLGGCSLYNKDGEYILISSVWINVEKFGNAYPTRPGVDTGYSDWNFNLFLFCPEIDSSNLKGKLKLEFGLYSTLNDIHSGFINLYIGDTFIGVCRYETKTVEDMTYAFYYNLFAEELILNLNIK